ncbi:HAMP domain-containing sensor histidine kinase [Falsirhodobacter sp. alg1]|uniref:sensor histidine kinase n=1 Tax=Falsirhodobacter sp. alg1 TaxID=1472418 RepID=UPI0005EF3F1E|nr:HAMP domain-containing sensor histidine kinase [Falsirhodobacter sp. alg1]
MKRPVRLRRWTLRGRLLRNVLLTVAGGWIITAAAGVYALNYEMREMLDDTMEIDASLVLHLLESNNVGTIRQWVDTHPGTDKQMVRVYDADQAVTDVPWPALEEDGFSRFEGWLVLRRSSDVGVVELGQSLGWRHEELVEAGRAFLWLILPLMLLVTLGVTASLRASLRGLSGFTAEIFARQPDDLSPLVIKNLPQELRIMAKGLNRYLERIRDLRKAERSFVANAAHELRTPLAVIRTRLQLIAEKSVNAPDPQDVIASVDQLSRRVERLLQLSRAEARLGLARQQVDLVALVRMLCAEQRIDSRSIVFDDADIETSVVTSDPDALAIILRNLLDNAVEHGCGRIHLRLGEGPSLTIANTVRPDAAISLDRFAKSRNSSGTGLGLNIVSALCADLKISLNFRQKDGLIEAVLVFAGPRNMGAEGDITRNTPAHS